MTPLPSPALRSPRDLARTTATNPYLADVELAQHCADHLEQARHVLVGLLTQHETYETATAEVTSSIDTLRNLHRELAHLRQGAVADVAVFLPINLPLYSLVLFAAIPSLMAERVDVRLPAATPTWVRAVAEAAHLEAFFPRVHLNELSRRRFIQEHASGAEAVIFTGRYESAEEVRAQCPSSRFIFQGSGVNPIVIGPDARLTRTAIDDMVTARVFNGGQDCAAPDAFLVHTQRADEFVRAIVDAADQLVSGHYGDPAVRVGTILNPNTLGALEQRLAALAPDTVLGGLVDREANYVTPTVIVRPLAEHDELMEFFAPVFYILVYDDDDELAEFFDHPEYRDNAMYVSLYGQRVVASLFESSTVLFDQTVLDVEQGNVAFGGNGAKANFVAYGGAVEVGPSLMSEALACHLRAPSAPVAETAPVTDVQMPSEDWWVHSDVLANDELPRRERLPRVVR